MELTTKEKGLLKDLKNEEMLCVKKYDRYASEANAPELRELFSGIAQTERGHHKAITDMESGQVPEITPPSQTNNEGCGSVSYSDEEEKKKDAFMCQDMLTVEKHVSSVYNTSVFEFKNPDARKMLNHIQAEEQQHGECIYSYMSNNNMC